LVPTLIAECELPLQQCTLEFCETLAMLEPFGAGNPEPRFLLRNVNLQDARCVGATKTHLQGIVKGRKVIGFGLGHLHEHTGESLDLLCRIGVDTWRGGRMPQLFLDDARIAETVAVAA
jgi:single-stranded-DNA-specific exonuclease